MITPLHSSNCPRGNFCSCCRAFRRKPSRKAFLGSGAGGHVPRKSEWLDQFRWQVALCSELRRAYFMVQKVWACCFQLVKISFWNSKFHQPVADTNAQSVGPKIFTELVRLVWRTWKSVHQEIKPNQVRQRKARKQKGKEKLKEKKGQLEGSL